MRFKIWGKGSGLRPARRLNREHVESVVIGALDGSVTGPAPDLPRRRLLRLGLVVAVLAILSGGAWAGRHWWAVGRYIETTDDAYIGGNVTAIAPHVSGFVAQVLAADNEHVHQGQVLVRLDPRDFQTALDHAAAVVAARTTEVEGLRARYTLQQSIIRQYEADRAAAEAQARSDLQTAQLDVGYTEIRSPIDGYVSNRAAQVGAYVKQGAYMVSVIPAAGL